MLFRRRWKPSSALFLVGLVLFVGLLLVDSSSLAKNDIDYVQMQQLMLKRIQEDTRATQGSTGVAQISPSVMMAMEKVQRHRFVPQRYDEYSYDNRPLPIGNGQTISQPFIVALMTELLNLEKTDKVLEVGTGSGYQAAILAELVGQVYTIEIIQTLADQAAETLANLNYENVKVKLGDGYRGWPSEAPFDAIIVTAAATEIPPPLLQQLKAGGRMIIPLGEQNEVQQLKLITKAESGEITISEVLAVRFVPLTGDH
ncbi:protein-L-isoaspartate(D-aspartate) O-methyltransferase [Aliikangiella marina]|uniref:Protein-L-isoaspartate O-methyltransferase n=1 Tax=Aliikangiella marina TaxID=1712262 RepID=A0A545T9Y8_9GAMM|nr:protein-L-isoaspartate(D-aspartate) O-methyltransferase [Aliikangiella marina]TQV74026.1 protein-L-isoaspartate(D-aspartate) O-methyltransferase [Aliikangiella marina]